MKKSDQPHILIVDDEERLRHSLQTLLTKDGYNVQTAADGKEALELYDGRRFDLVISDIRLPELDGIHLLQGIRKRDPDALVILMTGYASLETALAAINMGAYDYLMKPIEFAQLKLAARRALEKRELELSRTRLLLELQDTNNQLNRSVAEVNALYQAGLVLSQSHDLNDLLTKIISLSLEVIGATVGSVMLLDEDISELSIAAAVGMTEEVRRTTRVKLGNSIAGYVAQKGEALLVTDIRTDPRFKQFAKGKYETASLISAPLRVKDRTLGVINLSDPKVGTEFGDADLKLLVTFAAQAAIAIEDAEHLELLNKKLNEFSALYKLASSLTTIDNSREMTGMIYKTLEQIMPVDFAVWLTWQERTDTLIFNYWEGLGRREAVKLIGRSVMLKEKTVYSSTVRTQAIREEIEQIPYLRDKVRTLTTVPIITKGALHGVFCLGSGNERAFSPDDVNIASIVASQATAIYEQQRALLNATRLMTMGRMMSEIAHDLKKPLTNIRGSLQIMRERWPEITQSDDFFLTAEQEMLRLNELVRELVDFSNPKKYQLEQKRVADLFKRVVRLVENDLNKHGIKFVQEFEEGLPSVMVNENEIIELLLNLVINAVDAMPNGGTLTVKAFGGLDQNSPRPYVTLQLTDTGEGIPPEVQHRVFDRYYTTKESGTGLGLAICERIVMAHNGEIQLESTQGVGTTFTVKLPAA